MKVLRWAAVFALAQALMGCTSWDHYAAGQNQKYSGEALFSMYQEWGTPISRTRLVTGGRFYQFRKQPTGCTASVWTDDLDIVVRLAVSGPGNCAAGS